MIFETEADFRYWLKINGYTQDIIEELSYKWDKINIINGQITDAVTQIDNIEEQNEISSV